MIGMEWLGHAKPWQMLAVIPVGLGVYALSVLVLVVAP